MQLAPFPWCQVQPRFQVVPYPASGTVTPPPPPWHHHPNSRPPYLLVTLLPYLPPIHLLSLTSTGETCSVTFKTVGIIVSFHRSGKTTLFVNPFSAKPGKLQFRSVKPSNMMGGLKIKLKKKRGKRYRIKISSKR